MSARIQAVLLQVWFFIGLPILGEVLYLAMGLPGTYVFLMLFMIWCWELFAFGHYRSCRQEEFVHMLRTAAVTGAPVEGILDTYLEDRPKSDWYHLWVAGLLFFVFPGYYFVHRLRSYDTRLRRVLRLLFHGYSLSAALQMVPGVASRETALAVSVGQFTGRLRYTLRRLPESRQGPRWLELAPRLWYPLLLLSVLVSVTMFVMVFIFPRFEKIYADFRFRLPDATVSVMNVGRWVAGRAWLVPLALVLAIVALNVLLFSSRAAWYCPVIGRIYRMNARGQFLQTLGTMLDAGRPVPEVLEHLIASGLLPKEVGWRAQLLATDLANGQPMAESLEARGLATRSMRALIAAGERAQNLPWALQEIGDALIRRSVRLSYRIALVAFPLAIFGCACLIGLVAVGLFTPLTGLMEEINVKIVK
jgi:type II secretory pathway component PulF